MYHILLIQSFGGLFISNIWLLTVAVNIDVHLSIEALL